MLNESFCLLSAKTFSGQTVTINTEEETKQTQKKERAGSAGVDRAVQWLSSRKLCLTRLNTISTTTEHILILIHNLCTRCLAWKHIEVSPASWSGINLLGRGGGADLYGYMDLIIYLMLNAAHFQKHERVKNLCRSWRIQQSVSGKPFSPLCNHWICKFWAGLHSAVWPHSQSQHILPHSSETPPKESTLNGKIDFCPLTLKTHSQVCGGGDEWAGANVNGWFVKEKTGIRWRESLCLWMKLCGRIWSLLGEATTRVRFEMRIWSFSMKPFLITPWFTNRGN